MDGATNSFFLSNRYYTIKELENYEYEGTKIQMAMYLVHKLGQPLGVFQQTWFSVQSLQNTYARIDVSVTDKENQLFSRALSMLCIFCASSNSVLNIIIASQYNVLMLL